MRVFSDGACSHSRTPQPVPVGKQGGRTGAAVTPAALTSLRPTGTEAPGHRLRLEGADLTDLRAHRGPQATTTDPRTRTQDTRVPEAEETPESPSPPGRTSRARTRGRTRGPGLGGAGPVRVLLPLAARRRLDGAETRVETKGNVRGRRCASCPGGHPRPRAPVAPSSLEKAPQPRQPRRPGRRAATPPAPCAPGGCPLPGVPPSLAGPRPRSGAPASPRPSPKPTGKDGLGPRRSRARVKSVSRSVRGGGRSLQSRATCERTRVPDAPRPPPSRADRRPRGPAHGEGATPVQGAAGLAHTRTHWRPRAGALGAPTRTTAADRKGCALGPPPGAGRRGRGAPGQVRGRGRRRRPAPSARPGTGHRRADAAPSGRRRTAGRGDSRGAGGLRSRPARGVGRRGTVLTLGHPPGTPPSGMGHRPRAPPRRAPGALPRPQATRVQPPLGPPSSR